MNKRINLLIIISLFFLTGCSQEKQTKGIYINSDSQLQTELLKKNSSPFLPDRIENLKNLTRNYSKDYKNNYSEIKILLHKLNSLSPKSEAYLMSLGFLEFFFCV